MNAVPTFYNERVQFQGTFYSIRIVVEGEKHWLKFVMPLLKLAAVGLTTFFALDSLASRVERIGLSWTALTVVVLIVAFIVQAFRGARHAVEFLTAREILEIDNQQVAIEKSILGLRDRQEFPAEDIRQITLHPMRLKQDQSEEPALLIRHHRGLVRYCTFGRGIGTPDAKRMLEAIHRRFPHYAE